MKSYLKRILTVSMLITVLFNFILCNHSSYVVYAEEVNQEAKDVNDSLTPSKNHDLIESGAGVVWDILGAVFGVIAGILVSVINIFPILLQVVISSLAGFDVGGKFKLITIGDIVFNDVTFLDANYMDFTTGTDVTKAVKDSVAKYYYMFRLISLALSLFILIYVGIRLAMSTLAQDKARYKMMLIGWVESVILLFCLQYIISILFAVGNGFEKILIDLRDSLGADELNFEEVTMEKIFSFFGVFSGWEYVMYSVVYWYMVSLQIKFFITYLKRFITIGFLILISPFISIVYALDKVADGRAQSFYKWINEITTNIIIQPIDAAIYLVYMITAGAIAEHSIFFALLILTSITKIEKVILGLFNTKPHSLHHVKDQKVKLM